MKGKYPEYPAEPISDVRDMFLKSTVRYAEKVALQSKQAGRWVPITYGGLRTTVEQTACGLAALGIKPVENKLALVGNNRPEWAAGYLAAVCTGIVCVPIDKDLREMEVQHILYLSGAETLIGDARHIEMVQNMRSRLPALETLVSMDEAEEKDGVLGLQQLQALGRDRIAAGQNDFLQRSVTPEHLLAILFTSGTMGNSKGVMLTHGNVACNIYDAVKWVDLNSEDHFLSVLPMHHSYECTDGFLLALYCGACTSYAENLRRIVENMTETKTTAILGVPLLWHAIYKKIESEMAVKGMRKVKIVKGIASFFEKAFRLKIRRRLFSRVHEKFGGSLRILISGGAAIDPEVAKGYRELGLTFLQGYGLTESAPLLTVNRNEAFKDNAVGLPLPSVDIEIAEDGEVMAKGPNIMKGYYNNPEATDEAIRDGWLHTGDLGHIDEDGFLHISGRKKSVIVTASGKNIYPEEVETEIQRSPYILECLVWGAPDPQNGDMEIQAIVVPNIEHFIAQGLEKEGSINEERVENILRSEVKRQCSRLAPFKRVARLTVRQEEFEKTTTRKIKRYLYTGQPVPLK